MQKTWLRSSPPGARERPSWTVRADRPFHPRGTDHVALHNLDADDTDTRLRRPAVIRPRASVENIERPPGWRPLRIAMVGQKGMPATYGGIERHVEEMSARLVAYRGELTPGQLAEVERTLREPLAAWGYPVR